MPSRSGPVRCIIQTCSAAELEFPLEGVASTEKGIYLKLTQIPLLGLHRVGETKREAHMEKENAWYMKRPIWRQKYHLSV